MSINATYDSAFNANYSLASGQARRLGIVAGHIQPTYSSAGGLTWTLPFDQTLFVQVGNVQFAAATYVSFQYCYTSNMLEAFYWLPTTTASGLVDNEVASDTDFTTTTLSDHVHFVAFGLGR